MFCVCPVSDEQEHDEQFTLGFFCVMVDLDLWIMAAKCEMEDRNSSESARHLFLRALRFHPESKKVYQEVSDGDGL